MDGIGKELEAYLESLSALGKQAIDSMMKQIDEEAEKVFEAIVKETPVNRGDLKRSLVKKPVKGRWRWYGHEISFEGEAANGEPYEKIANILNYGTSTMRPRRFITKAIRKLKNMDDRIENRIEREMQGGDNGI